MKIFNKLQLQGQKFGRLTAIKDTEERRHGSVIWLCKCDCGNLIKARAHSIKSGNTKSCGCYGRENTSKRSKTHGLSKTRLYRIWSGMKSRCYDKNATFLRNLRKTTDLTVKQISGFFNISIRHTYKILSNDIWS